VSTYNSKPLLNNTAFERYEFGIIKRLQQGKLKPYKLFDREFLLFGFSFLKFLANKLGNASCTARNL
jgi:hypothetical protein